MWFKINKDASDRHLDCQPAVIDAKNFSAQLRRRLFWGNLPGLYTVQSNSQASTDHSLTLDKSLMPNSGRRATQAKVRTLTTNTNSLLQGRTENCANRKELASLFPVRFTFQTDDLKNADKRGCGSKENINPSKNSSTKTTKTALPPTDSFSVWNTSKVTSYMINWIVFWPTDLGRRRRANWCLVAAGDRTRVWASTSFHRRWEYVAKWSTEAFGTRLVSARYCFYFF